MSNVRPTPGAALAAARAHVQRGEKLDMVALAAELGVARATLYRWTGDRDQLLADAVWADVSELMASSYEAGSGTGATRIAATVGAFLDVLAAMPGLQGLLRNEGDAGLRLLTSPAGPVRPRIVAALAAAITAETEAGAYVPPAAPEVMADAIVALCERYLHNGGDADLNPDPETAKTIVGLLLRAG